MPGRALAIALAAAFTLGPALSKAAEPTTLRFGFLPRPNPSRQLLAQRAVDEGGDEGRRWNDRHQAVPRQLDRQHPHDL